MFEVMLLGLLFAMILLPIGLASLAFRLSDKFQYSQSVKLAFRHMQKK